MILVAVFASSPVAMLTAEGFGFIGAVVDEDGSVNHTLLIPPPMVRQCYGGVYSFSAADVAIKTGLPLVVIKVSYFFNHTL